MTALTLYAVRCDCCGHTEKTDATSQAGARRAAAENGWTRSRQNRARNQLKVDVCPDCSEETT